MAERLKLFAEEPLIAILPLTGIVVSVVLFVLFCRNRNRDRLTRRRFLLLSVLTPVHTVLLPLAILFESDVPALLWLYLVPILIFVLILYRFHYRKWENRDLRAATMAFAFYTVYLFFCTFLMFFWGHI